MQTERVTFLTSREHKAALDTFARESGNSVGHVLREASARYIAEPTSPDEYEEALTLVLPVLEEALAKWNGQIDSMEQSIDRAREAIDRALAGDPV
jgi:hypothetical protein